MGEGSNGVGQPGDLGALRASSAPVRYNAAIAAGQAAQGGGGTTQPGNVVSAAQAAVAAIGNDSNYCSSVKSSGSAVNSAVHNFKVAWNAANPGGQLTYNGQFDAATAAAISTAIGSAGPASCGAPAPPAPALMSAANSLLASLASPQTTIIGVACEAFQIAWNQNNSLQIEVDGDYGPCTASALQSVLTAWNAYATAWNANPPSGPVQQNMMLLPSVAPPSLYAGTCVNGRYVPPSTPTPPHLLPTKYRYLGVGPATPQPINSANCGGLFRWVHQTDPKQFTPALLTYIGNLPPRVYYFTYLGQTWKYVNNMDGSVQNEPSIPAGNTGLFICMVAVHASPLARGVGAPGENMTGLGQAPSCAAWGLPQAACDAAYAYGQAYAASGGTVPDPTDVIITFKQWYTAATGQAPSALLDVTQPPASTLLSSAFSYWTQFASQNPAAAAQISEWMFPWQFVPQGSATDPNTAVLAALMNMLQSPAALQVLNQGQLPAFDPTQIANWASVFSDPSTFATLASGVAAILPAVQQFVQLGAQCNLFSQPASVVQTAFTQYNLYGGNPQDPRGVPCNAIVGPTGPTGGPPLPAGPTGPTGAPAPTPVVIQGQVPSPTPTWVPYAVAAGGALVVGLLVYAATRKPAHPGMTENPVSYAGWRAAVANQLLNRYGLPYHDINQILDMPGPSGEPVAHELYAMRVTPSQAAQRIAMAYHQRVRASLGA